LKIPEDDAFAWIQQKYGEISEETKKKIEDNVGMNFQYYCLDCLAENYLDKGKDEMKCKNCGSSNLKYVADLVGQPCPKCKVGTIEMVNKGMS
jgi:Zn finger protein HypA/HybF involved in hydrogenase expression